MTAYMDTKGCSLASILPDGHSIEDDIVPSGQPPKPHIAALGEAGYRTVLDTRAPEDPRSYDEPEAAAKAGMQYLVLPVRNRTIPEETFDRFRQILRDGGNQPLLIHCGSGNRVGALLIPYLGLDRGMCSETVMVLAKQVGLRDPELAHAATRYIYGND